MLKIFRLQEDPDVLDIDKAERTRRWFYIDAAPSSWEEALGNFARAGDTPEQSSSKDFDYEFDAPEIYASFMQLYGTDLFESNMHWWKFRALLAGCFACACALSRKLRLRNIDPSECRDKAAAQQAKNAVQIPMSVGENDMLINSELQERLMRGEAIEDLLR